MSPPMAIPFKDSGNKQISSGHLQSLDGLRAISILLVIIGHLSGTRNFGPSVWIGGLGDIAHLGVVVFFVISGFLITTLLQTEHEKYGSVSLKLFYARRAIRIFPASFVYLAVVSSLALAGIIQLHRHDIIHALTYTVNYHVDRSWFIGHLWSLSVEEQFYLLWPFAFVALGWKRSLWVSSAVIIVGPLARAAAWFFFRGTPYRDLEMFPMVADSLAAGCILAGARQWLETQKWYLALFRPAVSLLLLSVVFITNRLLGYTLFDVFGRGLINILLAILIHRSVYCWRDFVGRVLNWRPLAFCGVLSYSLYIWQQLFINRTSGAWINAFPQNLLFAIIAALMSYMLLEQPLMALRHRLHNRKTPDLPSLSNAEKLPIGL